MEILNARLSKPADLKKILLTVTMGLALGFGTLKLLENRLSINTTASTSYNLFWTSPGKIEVGDFVTFKLDEPIMDHPAIVVKRVRCGPGQWLKVTDEAAWCDEVLLGFKKPYTLKGEPMPKFTYEGEIPEDWVFLMNEHKDSFDSRYYGLKPLSIMTRVKPIF